MTAFKAELKTGHVGLNVSDLERSEAFYRAALGLQAMGGSREAGRSYAFLGDGDTLMLTLWQQSAGTFSASTPGLHHLSFEVESTQAVQEAQQRVRELGAAFLYEGVVPHAEGTTSGGIFFQDPDGIRLEIYAPSATTDSGAPSGESPTCGFF